MAFASVIVIRVYPLNEQSVLLVTSSLSTLAQPCEKLKFPRYHENSDWNCESTHKEQKCMNIEELLQQCPLIIDAQPTLPHTLSNSSLL